MTDKNPLHVVIKLLEETTVQYSTFMEITGLQCYIPLQFTSNNNILFLVVLKYFLEVFLGILISFISKINLLIQMGLSWAWV